jgi:hypothetical protein
MRKGLLLILMVFFGAVCATGAQSGGFVPLFNGKDLDGWVNVNCAPETWSVREGMIICTGFPTGVLRTEKQYQNYILELEWKHLHKGGNAGLFLHSDALTARGQPFTRSVEVQIMDGNHGDIFAIHGARVVPAQPHPRGYMRALPTEDRANPAGEWNHYRVESRDGIITLAVNGKVVSQVVNSAPRKGYICLESEGSEVHFRNLRIKEMPGGPVPPELVASKDEGFKSLFNGLDLRGWKVAPGNEGHWSSKDWILDYDGKSEAEGENRNLWSEGEYGNFILIADWRQPKEPVVREVPVVLPNGLEAENSDGTPLVVSVMDAGDSGIYLRGSSKSQVNIWNWPVGSGEVYGYRTDEKMSAEVRAGVTPILNADEAPGSWNRFVITMIGDKLSVVLNGKTVLREALLPGVEPRGPLALQHHGDPIQFANIYIKELD